MHTEQQQLTHPQVLSRETVLMEQLAASLPEQEKQLIQQERTQVAEQVPSGGSLLE